MTWIKDPQSILVLYFQILVTLDTISDWPRWVSWQHFYRWGLPTKKLQATVLTSLKASHTFTIFFFVLSSFKRTGAWGKSWSHQIYVYDFKSAATTIGLAYPLPSDDRSILSTVFKSDFSKCLLKWIRAFCESERFYLFDRDGFVLLDLPGQLENLLVGLDEGLFQHSAPAPPELDRIWNGNHKDS
jgi:hypothetical protein